MFDFVDFFRADKDGVRVDRQGHVVAHFPMFDEFVLSSDDSLASLEEAIALNEGDDSILELMRHDIDSKKTGSRGSRRRQSRREPVKKNQIGRNEDDEAVSMGLRFGRPLVGNEPRVCVQTSITEFTREMLRKHGVTLAGIFDAYARRLVPYGI